MEIGIIAIAGFLISAVVGFFLGKTGADKTMTAEVEKAKIESEKLISDGKHEGEKLKNDLVYQAKEKANNLITEAERKAQEKKVKVLEFEQKIKSRENSIQQKEKSVKQKQQEFGKVKKELQGQLAFIDKTKQELAKVELVLKNDRGTFKKDVEDLNKQKKEIEKAKEAIEKNKAGIEKEKEALKQKEKAVEERKAKVDEEIVAELEKLSGFSKEEAKTQLIDAMKEKARTDAMAHIKQIKDEAKISANREAKKIVLQSIQRLAAEHAIENCVSVFNLDTDDIKGQIIGREGRNIRALESATGVEIIVDDTPGAIVISSYDPVRRETARLSLQRLVADGRIHPARIEEVVTKTRTQLEQHIVEIGERTVIDLKIHGLAKEMVRLVGKMRYRSSYGQNLLKHSREVANLCALMAAELGLNKKQIQKAKRAGLLHDIGKVSDEESELSHAILGMKLAEKYKEKPDICNAIGAHHDEVEMSYIISPIVQACDAISGARPGARREILEAYLQRIKDLETLALGYEGVEKAYAMQAGRELRVIVQSEIVTDEHVDLLAFEISERIQSEMQYPGQIKVNVIREKRSIAFAK